MELSFGKNLEVITSMSMLQLTNKNTKKYKYFYNQKGSAN